MNLSSDEKNVELSPYTLFKGRNISNNFEII